MLVFFDESGDTGFKIGQGSSDLFTVTLVIFEEHDEATAAGERIALLRRELGKSADYEFHFTACSDAIRRAFLAALSRYDFFFFSFVFDKSAFSAQQWSSSDEFYRYVCGLIFESSKPHLDNAIVKFDACGGRDFREKLGTYLKRRMNDAQSSRRAIKKVVASKSNGTDLIQLADMICGSVAHAQNGKKSNSSEFYDLIKHRGIWVRRWP